jgi:hypothetical protein
MLMISALSMTVALCFQAVLNVVLSNNLIDFEGLGVSLISVSLAQDGLTVFGRMMGGVFLLSAARPLSGASEGMRSVLYGGGAIFLVAALLTAMATVSALMPGDPMQELRFATDADGLTIRVSYSAVFLLCDVMIAIFAIYAGMRFRGAMLGIGIITAILCCVLIAHDVADIWFGTIAEFGFDYYDDSEGTLGDLWFAEGELRWRVMSIVDAVTKVLFALIACLTASRLLHPPGGQDLRAQ